MAKQKAEVIQTPIPSDMYQIHKVKHTDSQGVEIEYSKKNLHGGYDRMSLQNDEAPRPEFTKALTQLAPFVAEICEFPDEYAFGVLVKGVTFAPKGVKLSAMKGLSVGSMQFNTPLRAMADDGESDTALSKECNRALALIKREAIQYIEGERAQGHLFEEKK
jgi:hypothetical protein